VWWLATYSMKQLCLMMCEVQGATATVAQHYKFARSSPALTPGAIFRLIIPPPFVNVFIALDLVMT
jgi:hypothetical protein